MSAEPHQATTDSEGVRAPAPGTARDVPHGAAAKALPPCDLVMKGGITSGVVYPGLVRRLATNYRFASIGGTSAGAIAAAVCAAAEFARQRDDAGAMARLDRVMDDLKCPGFLLGLFQPTPDARPLFEVLMRAVSSKAPVADRAREALVAAAQRRPMVPLAALVVLTGLGALAVASFAALPDGLAVALTLLVALPLALLVVVATGLAAAGLLVMQTARSLGASGFGMCPGTKQGAAAGDALVEWLDARIQDCAGRTKAHAPLTFGELEKAEIQLTMMTTDLTSARPVRVPDDLGDYLFDPGELRGRFPDRVVHAMVAASLPGDPGDERGLRIVPTKDLPVLVGVRLSLSFPILFSAVPLYLSSPETPRKVTRHVFSDGGISSNFPVHLFDAWLPRRPTFGIDLVEHPAGAGDDVFMTANAAEPLPPSRRDISSLFTFLAAIFDTLQNWRDALQSELPGSRDRICQIRFAKGQGGLNLGMDPNAIADLVARGYHAGDRIVSVYDGSRWDAHRFVRYLTLMGQLQDNLHRAGAPFGAFGPVLNDGLPKVDVYRDGHDAAWCRAASAETAQLLALGATWGQPPPAVDFRGPGLPTPEPVLRNVPRA